MAPVWEFEVASLLKFQQGLAVYFFPGQILSAKVEVHLLSLLQGLKLLLRLWTVDYGLWTSISLFPY